MPSDKLNQRQIHFVQEYLVDGNGKRAAIDAGYAPKTAEVTASQLLRNPKIEAALEKGRRNLTIRTEISQDRVTLELARVAFASMSDYIRIEDGVPIVDFTQMPEGGLAAVAEVYQEVEVKKAAKGETKRILKTKFKLHDKLRALALLQTRLPEGGKGSPGRMRLGLKMPDGTTAAVEYDNAGEPDLSLLTDEQLDQYTEIARILDPNSDLNDTDDPDVDLDAH